VESEEVEIVFG